MVSCPLQVEINMRAKSLIEQRGTYTLERNGKFSIIENVPARVNPETGEQFFSLNTVERLQLIILGNELRRVVFRRDG
ncbi:MAG: hypothetical protein ONB13_00435 [candidate division KSB1 bacterium]|nr:hypothetical protein [candidate division KSB1 bacterium]MDZ7375061.1 hypothetical protein [candidate division KSB1 bacterium]MDZ7401334.1 hypothetical protein [candidate division KSB1 bacterium]